MTEVSDVWNVESLKESVDQRFADNQKAIDTALLGQEKAVGAAFLASEKAIIKAEILTDKRFDGVTKSVTDLATQTSDLMPRAEYVANHKALDDKIEVINSTLSKTNGDKNLFVTTSELDNKLASVVDRMDSAMKPVIDYVARQQGQAQGSHLTIGNIYAAIGATAAVVGIIVVIATSVIK